jgi:hypothetical protein
MKLFISLIPLKCTPLIDLYQFVFFPLVTLSDLSPLIVFWGRVLRVEPKVLKMLRMQCTTELLLKFFIIASP